MRIENLEYHSPSSLKEACGLLDTLGSNARILAGGTDVLADLKQGTLTADHLVSLANIKELKVIKAEKTSLWIGALVTPNELANSSQVKELFTGLSDAGASMAGMQIRNLATIGGNLSSAVPSADLPPSLLTVQAELELVSAKGKRIVPIKNFFKGPRETDLKPGEILSGIRIPSLPEGTGTAYEKFQLRDASALAVVGVAARLTVKDNKILIAHIAVGAAAPTPLLIEEACTLLQGKEPSEEIFSKAGELVHQNVQPISDLRGSEEYRRDLAGVLTKRALNKANSRI